MDHQIGGIGLGQKDFSIIVVADTQNVAKSNQPEQLVTMAEWIIDHAEEWNIQKVLHVGDVVDDGIDNEQQWENHRQAFDRIDAAGIPLLFSIGNHDYDNLLTENRDATAFNKHCGGDRFIGKDWFGGQYEHQAENMYTLLNIEGEKYMFMTLEFAPRSEVIDWANDVIKSHSDHKVIMVTHSFLYIDGTHTAPGANHHPHDYVGTQDGHDGKSLWEKCIKKHPNITAVYSGHHVGGNVSHRLDEGEHGNLVFQSFQNWQLTENGGQARFRLVHYRPKEGIVQLHVVNPQTNTFEKEDGYEIEYPLGKYRKDKS